ncbi:TPA: hypothetical protein WIE06_001755 [Neisseria meningitidis]|uniref:hypothetical protein n=1 Tax=Neisseria lactamica TaxID=486 RepID=UPI0018656562|nr:hypothetical protein [Neisseria lactamica]MCL6016403.1 hypothetical protein [Neisseria meningitidis]
MPTGKGRRTTLPFNVCRVIVDEQKSGQGDEAADSTNSTEPIHLVLQHLRESFSLS